jgi:hypothetical protein
MTNAIPAWKGWKEDINTKMKSSKSHIHKYERRKLGKSEKGHDIYRCALPGCTHYLVDMDAVIGRYSLCWGNCDNLVEMTRYLVNSEKRKRPMCDECKLLKKESTEEKNLNDPINVEAD